MKKVLILAAIAAAVLAFFALDLDQRLTLEGIKFSQAQIEQWRSSAPLAVGLGFLIVYVLVTALSLPGAAVMTLAAGTFFGLLWGTIIVSFASTIGATLAFLVSRYVLRDSVQNRFGDRLKAINQGIEREGAFYLFTPPAAIYRIQAGLHSPTGPDNFSAECGRGSCPRNPPL